ncbi:MAG TPA: hypothetical protein PKO36_09000 [Candidatus Hydrogenedentes bacterium]|nr:hypothetical protein [Candidatus Hydrogenedentota bacterium]HOV73683.1 hypothetical protein [Candidatus Hydrogenedentota bacterium]HPC16272.1 hypothetical protein [Candidatus Hydrogenedentota bacterium]HRT21654.1 hypothetical protein [Candidatus Hydrogenedentota bacterium]HRT66896.1 hypothetical protein [Candidatus Hydrogenedentota bacterium]
MPAHTDHERNERRENGLAMPGGRRCREWILVLAIFVVATAGSWGYMTASGLRPGTNEGDTYLEIASAARWTLGYGFREPPGSPIYLIYSPAFFFFCLQRIDFLMEKADALPRDQAPPPMLFPFEGDPKFIYDRLYLLYCMGLLWKVTGISWSSLNYLVAIFAGLSAIAGYGLFRLGMGRILATIATAFFISSPVFLNVLPRMRDLAKAPFFLAAILVVGILLAKTPGKRALAALAAGAGLLCGAGMGFRPDILVLPPALLAAFLFAPAAARHTLGFRGVLVGLFLFCFLVPAFPVLKMNRETGGGNSPFYLLQGFSHRMMADMDMSRASYGPFCSDDDFLIHAGITQYALHSGMWNPTARRATQWALGAAALPLLPASPLTSLAWVNFLRQWKTDLDFWNEDSSRVTRSMMRDLASTFPADFATRWLGATLRCIRGIQGRNFAPNTSNPVMDFSFKAHQPFAEHWRKYSLGYGALALSLIVARDLRMGLGMAILLLYFCGYTSLGFQPRHVFHMDCVSVWLAGFLLSQGIRLPGRIVSFHRRFPFIHPRPLPGIFLSEIAGRLLFFATAGILFLAVPILTIRLWQDYRVEKIITRYQTADLEPLPIIQTPQPDGTILYSPASLPDFRRSLFSPEILCEYLVLEFQPANNGDSLQIQYEGSRVELDHRDIPPRFEPAVPAVIRYFFPVYSFSKGFQDRTSAGFGLPDFAGIAVPASVSVKGLYRVRNKSHFPLLMNVWLPDDIRLFKRHYALSLAP